MITQLFEMVWQGEKSSLSSATYHYYYGYVLVIAVRTTIEVAGCFRIMIDCIQDVLHKIFWEDKNKCLFAPDKIPNQTW